MGRRCLYIWSCVACGRLHIVGFSGRRCDQIVGHDGLKDVTALFKCEDISALWCNIFTAVKLGEFLVVSSLCPSTKHCSAICTHTVPLWSASLILSAPYQYQGRPCLCWYLSISVLRLLRFSWLRVLRCPPLNGFIISWFLNQTNFNCSKQAFWLHS